jgi:hypothetical protein
MKPKQRKKTTKGPISGHDIPTVYDISSELLECKKQGLKARPAIAWMEGGRIQVSMDKDFLTKRPVRKTREEISQEWFDEIGLSFAASYHDQSPGIIANKVRYVRCVAASEGDRWGAWKVMDVCRFLMNPPGTPLGQCVSILPVEYTIFDPDKAAGVWFTEHETELFPRYLDFGIGLLNEIARVYCLAVEFIEDFEETFDSLDERCPRNKATRPADLLRNCKKAAINMIESVSLMDSQRPKKLPDAAVAIRQGFLIGTWLAQAEGIIGNVKDMKLAVQQAVSGQHTSVFWNCIIKLQETSLKGKTASELYTWLDGKPDPEFKGFNLQIVDDELKRGNGDTIKLAAFKSALSRAKARIRNKSRTK